MPRHRQRRLYHLARTADRDSILHRGLVASEGWDGGPGCYVTTDPESWLFLYEENRHDDEAAEIAGLQTSAVDVWAVDVAWYRVVQDQSEVAEPGEDFVVRVKRIPPERLKLVRSLVRNPKLQTDANGRLFYKWNEVGCATRRTRR